MARSWEPKLGCRALFPELRADAYLNHAAISPICQPVAEAVQAATTDYARYGVQAFPRWEERRQRLKVDLAKLIGADAGELALGWNTSRGVSDVALSLPWRAGDRVLLLNGEFPANVTPWQRAAELFQLQLVFHDADAYQSDAGLSRLEAELTRGLRLVAVSAVQFQTGLRMPLAEIGALCRAHGAELFVDAIQACGVVPLDVEAEHIDYLSSGGHKWLLGVEGAGFIYVREHSARSLRPHTASWLSHEEPLGFLFQGAGKLRYDRELRRRADVFETGTSSLLGHAALSASVPLLLSLGAGAIHRHVGAYLDRLESGLVERGFTSLRAQDPSKRSCILSVQPPPGTDAIALSADLRARGVITGTPDGLLRFSPHFANGFSEISHVLEAIDSALAQAGSCS
jgi:selenocysteine lyase/cysteine desulfurase